MEVYCRAPPMPRSQSSPHEHDPAPCSTPASPPSRRPTQASAPSAFSRAHPRVPQRPTPPGLAPRLVDLRPRPRLIGLKRTLMDLLRTASCAQQPWPHTWTHVRLRPYMPSRLNPSWSGGFESKAVAGTGQHTATALAIVKGGNHFSSLVELNRSLGPSRV